MDTYKLKFTNIQSEIFSLLCLRAGEKLSQRDIAKALKVSPTTVASSTKELKGRNIIKVEKTKTINFVSLNMDEKTTIDLKKIENLRNIYTSGLSDYLFEEIPGTTIILFGSYSRGEDSKNSDIDFAVVGRKDKTLSLDKFEQILNRRININFYESWAKINKHLKNNILSGTTISGGVEL